MRRRRGAATDREAVGIEQPGAGAAEQSGRVDGDAGDVELVTRGLDVAAVAALRAARSVERPPNLGRAIGPDGDHAADALVQGPGQDLRAGIDLHRRRMGELAAALPAAADGHRAAAGTAAGIDPRRRSELHLLAGHRNPAAGLTGAAARDIERAGHLHGAGGAAVEHDLSALADGDGLGLDHTGGVDDVVDDAARDIGGDLHDAARGIDPAGVLGRRSELLAVGAGGGLQDLRIDSVVYQPVAIEIDGEGMTRGERDLAQTGIDHAGVLHAGRHEGR